MKGNEPVDWYMHLLQWTGSSGPMEVGKGSTKDTRGRSTSAQGKGKLLIRREMRAYTQLVVRGEVIEPAIAAKMCLKNAGDFALRCLMCKNAKKKPRDFDLEHFESHEHVCKVIEREQHVNLLRKILKKELQYDAKGGHSVGMSAMYPFGGQRHHFIMVKGQHDTLMAPCAKIRCLACPPPKGEGWELDFCLDVVDGNVASQAVSRELQEHMETKKHRAVYSGGWFFF